MIYTGEDTGLKSAKNQKIIAISLLLLGSTPVWSGLGGLQVNSALGEPFSGTVVVTGDEAKAALKGKPTISGANLQVRVTAQGKNAVIHLRSSNTISDPMLSFSLTAGNQGRQYTALLDPRSYAKHETNSRESNSRERNNKEKNKSKNKPSHTSQRNSSEARARAALNNAFASDSAVGEYLVDKNETLIDVARKVTPQGLTLAQTMHALVIANPHAFKNGNPDVMYKNAKLKIPSAAQFARLAKLKKGSVVNLTVTIPDEGSERSKEKIPQTASVKEENGAGTKKDNTNPAVTQGQTVTADTSTNATSAPATASAVVASTESAASSSSAVAAEHVEPRPASAVKPAQPAPTPVESAPAVEEENLWSEWWPYALGGVAGVLLIAVFIWMRGRKKNADSDEYDEEDYEEQVGDEEDDDEENDDIIFEETPVLSNKSITNSDVANKAQDKAEANTTKATTVDKAADDWSWLTEDEIPAQNMPNSTPVQKEDTKISSVVQTPNTAAVKEETSIDNEDWLNFNYDNKSLVSDTGKEQTSAVESNAHDLSWLEQLEEPEKFEQVQQNVNTSQRKVFKEQPDETLKAGFDDAIASSDFKWASSEDDQQPKSEDITVDDIFSATQAKQIDDKIQFEEESFLAAEKADQQISDLSEVENDASQPDTNWYRDKPIPQWNVDFRTDSKSELVKKEIVNPDEQQLMSETLVAQDQEAFASKDNVVSADIDWEGLNLDKEEPALSTNDETIASRMHDEKVIPDLSSEDIAIGLDYEDSSLSLSTEEMAINLDHESANSASEGGEVAESFNYDDLSLSLADDESTSSALNYENQTVKSSADDNIPELATFDEEQTSQPDEEKNDLSSLDFTLSDDFEISVPSDVHIYEEEKPETQSASTPTSAFATGTGAQEWENEKPKTDQPLTPEQMAVPLQAKLELAKMYLEMDDAVTARQTLRELVEEANGVILTEAQSLLHQLGG